MVLSYNGQEFSGSQRQPGKRTIQGELESALKTLAGRNVAVSLAGRTDRGVHARGQVGSCLNIRPEMTTSEIRRALLSILPEDISVFSVERVDDAFDPRRSAKWRHYRYRIRIGPRNPLDDETVLGLDGPRTRCVLFTVRCGSRANTILHRSRDSDGEHRKAMIVSAGVAPLDEFIWPMFGARWMRGGLVRK